MFLIPLLFILVIGWLFFMMLPSNHHYTQNRQQNYSTNKPMEILKERYAKGEIAEEEYLKVKRNLE